MAIKTVLVVCTGNTCRSPMAAGWLNHKLAGTGWVATSAGVAAGEGAPASAEALDVMREIGVNMSSHRSRGLDKTMADEATYILAMTQGHQNEIVARFPNARDNVCLVDAFGARPPQDIADPIGGSLDVYRHVRDEIIQALGDFLVHLAETGELRR